LSRLLLRRNRKAPQPLVVQTAREERHSRHLGESKIYDLYHWDQVLQEDGDGGKVVVCRAKSSKDSSPTSPRSARGQQFVMKMRRKQSIQAEGMEKQFRRVQHRLLNFPLHPGVMPLHEELEDDHCFYTLMEKAEGGPLFSDLLAKYPDGVIPAKVVKKTVRQILSALAHVHRHGMLHRDIKPDNIVVHNGNPMLIDFDHADPDWNASEPKQVDGFFGTLRFSAPEAFRGYFSQQSDLYSVGVLLYLLMAGKLPRDDSILQPSRPTAGCSKWSEEVYMNLRREPGVDWKCDPWPSDPTCADFCQWLLHFFPQSRPTCAEEALCHPWLGYVEYGDDDAVAANASAES
jgi:serine/threonine protein kinase